MATDDLIGINSDGRLEDFAALVHTGLETADWLSQRELIRALVKRVEVAHDLVHVVFRVDQAPVAPRLEKKSLQDCRGSSTASLCEFSQRDCYRETAPGTR